MNEPTLPPLTDAARQFLKVLRMFNDKPMTLKYYALMLGRSRRWIRKLVKELREKGYIRVEPEHMKIYHKNHCRYIILANENGVLVSKESYEEFKEFILSEEIKNRLDLK